MPHLNHSTYFFFSFCILALHACSFVGDPEGLTDRQRYYSNGKIYQSAIEADLLSAATSCETDADCTSIQVSNASCEEPVFFAARVGLEGRLRKIYNTLIDVGREISGNRELCVLESLNANIDWEALYYPTSIYELKDGEVPKCHFNRCQKEEIILCTSVAEQDAFMLNRLIEDNLYVKLDDRVLINECEIGQNHEVSRTADSSSWNMPLDFDPSTQVARLFRIPSCEGRTEANWEMSLVEVPIEFQRSEEVGESINGDCFWSSHSVHHYSIVE